LYYATFLTETLTLGHGDPATIKMMTDLQVRISPTLGWVLGWSVQETDWGMCFWHFGENYHSRSIAMGFPEKRAGLIVL
jgi:hypothetical protein